MFDKNFNFDMERENISEEIRKILAEAKINKEGKDNFLMVWKRKILELSGNN